MSIHTPKRVLAVCFSQTGQLQDIADQILAPLNLAPEVSIHIERLKPRQKHPFPWTFLRFFDTFPETAHLDPIELEPLQINSSDDFDLVIIFYQVWFLAPSLPITSFLKHPTVAQVLKDKPVITVIACRNMWMMAQEKTKLLLNNIGARLIDNVVFTDKSNVFATLITTPRWLLTGKKEGFWGLPRAGVSEYDTVHSRRFGHAILDGLRTHAEQSASPLLSGLQAVQADPRLIISERAGTRSFFLWGKLLKRFGKAGAFARRPWVIAYVVFLFSLIITVVPISLTLQFLLRPLLRERLARQKIYFEQPSGSGDERMTQYDF